MGRKVLITYKIMPESVETDLSGLENRIKENLNNVEIKDIKQEPIAFGLKALKVLVMVEDKAGISDEIEKKLSELNEVESVETESITLI